MYNLSIHTGTFLTILKFQKKICQPCKPTFNSLPEKFLATELLVLQKFIEMRPVLTFLIFGSCWSELNELLSGWLSAKCFGGLHISLRSSCPEVFCKKGVLKNFTTSTRKHLCQSLFFNKVAGLRPVTLLKERLWPRCFLMNFTKFLRKPFLKKTPPVVAPIVLCFKYFCGYCIYFLAQPDCRIFLPEYCDTIIKQQLCGGREIPYKSIQIFLLLPSSLHLLHVDAFLLITVSACTRPCDTNNSHQSLTRR